MIRLIWNCSLNILRNFSSELINVDYIITYLSIVINLFEIWTSTRILIFLCKFIDLPVRWCSQNKVIKNHRKKFTLILPPMQKKIAEIMAKIMTSKVFIPFLCFREL